MSRLFIRTKSAADALGCQLENTEEIARDDDDLEARNTAAAAQDWFNPLTQDDAEWPLTIDVPAEFADLMRDTVENVEDTPDAHDDYTPGDAAIL